jgi:septin 7
MIKASITNQNREYVTDKNALMASLNNTNGSSHHYQNVQFQKPPQPSPAQQQPANSTESTVKKNIALITSSLEANGHTIGSNNVNKVNLSQSAVNAGINMNTSSPPANMLKTRTVEGYVGFANLPNQVYRKAVKKGFEFNLMVIGESGLGKSTFINSLFLTELYNSSEFPGTFERKKKTTYVDSTMWCLAKKVSI